MFGDVHLAFGPKDVEHVHAGGYDLALFVGDLSGYSHRGGLRVSRYVAQLRTPTIVIPGNHDAAIAPQLLAEVMQHTATIELVSGGQSERVQQLRQAIAPAVLAGYSLHPLGTGEGRIEAIVGRPHSFGGPYLAFRPYLSQAFGVSTLEESAAKLVSLVDRLEGDRVLFFAHNGPAGLGAKRADIWGCDFKRGEGDFGDPDLRVAIEHARQKGKRVIAVIGGHMHHALRGGGTRSWTLRDEDGALYVNAARVPRVFREEGKERRHLVEVSIDGERAEAREVLFA